MASRAQRAKIAEETLEIPHAGEGRLFAINQIHPVVWTFSPCAWAKKAHAT
jgi:hypothetical protein